jgi:hypothetical protein
MSSWDQDPAFAGLEELARKMEKALAATNEALIKLAKIDPARVVETFAQVQAKILGFDVHATRKLMEAIEDKRVNTYAMGNLFMACVMTSAVALSEFKKQPQPANASFLRRRLGKLRQFSTNGLSLAALAWASFNAVLGQGALHQLKSRRNQHSLQ